MQHKFKLATLSSLLCANAFATPVYQPPGPNLTYGSSSNNQSIMSSVANPAAPAAVLGMEDSQYRFGILHIGGGYEIGNVNDLFNQVDKASQDLKSPTLSNTDLTALATRYAIDCPTLTCSPTELVTFSNSFASIFNNSQTTATLNNVLSSVQQDGNATLFFGGHVPLTPFVISRKGWGGSFVLDANASVVANGSFLADPLFISNATATAYANAYIANPLAPNLPIPPNDSTMLVKAAAVGELGLGYSRSLLRREAPEPVEGEPTPGKLSASQLKAGELTAGGRVKFYQVGLANKAVSLTSMQDGSQDVLNDDLTYTKSTGFGLDVGALWTSKHYRAGAWVNNLNSPGFKYPTINTTSYDPTKGVKAQIDAGMTYTMKPQLQLEGAIFSESQNFVVNLGLDANAVQDPVGRDFQWMTLSAAYATSRAWVPGARVGYRSNLAGSKLSYLTGGLTWFGVSLDIAYGLDKLTYEGNSIPRSAMINLGLQMTF